MAEFSEERDGPSCKPCADYGSEEDNTLESTDGNTGIVYLITSEEGVPYVGITMTTLEKRMDQHRHAIKAGHGDGKKFIEYYQNHDFDKVDIKVIDRGTSRQELLQKERHYIQEYDSMNNGLNSEL